MRLADVQFSSRDRTVIAKLRGEVDLSNADGIGTAIVEAMPNDVLSLIMDLSEVDYVDSAGIQLIYQLRESLRARQQGLALVIPSGCPASEALRLAGITRYVKSAETLDEALREI